MPLENKVAIVTGGARGIGRAIATRLLRDGARVVIADCDEGAGQGAAEELAADGETLFVHCDVGERLDVNKLVKLTLDSFGAIDIAVCNAGIVHGADFLDLKEDDFDRVLRVNLKGAFLVGQAAARQMVAQVEAGARAGAIVNMSSINAVVTIANQLAYAVSKGGIAQLTKTMALALAPHGIRVNAVGPGSIMTDMLKSVNENPEARRRLLARTPLGRIGEAAEVANVVAFLASDEASYMTGQTLYPDGGRLALNYTVPVPD
ncbi:3-oxoacyl-[acyl-carrier protein] reductase [hydrothermal vent metagenome]|uniref:3-oxoacyl-[acyl-carrier protein] reductase n=1 Tax=hydrothermal vent metagenome TaxID=652676 RepID=A0A3B0TGR6_9ZZZZ